MQNRPVDPDAAALAKRLFRRPEEPATEFRPPVCVLYLLIIFHVIAHQQVRPLTLPQPAPNALFRALRDDAKPMPITHLTNNISIASPEELLHPELSNQVVILRQLLHDIPELLGRPVLRRTDEDDVVAGAEEALGEGVDGGKGG